MELGRRRQISEAPERPIMKKSKDVVPFIMPLLQDLNHEACLVLYLNQASRLLRQEFISNGGLAGTVVDIRMILKNCLLYNASQLIIAHNHPSGNKTASEADKKITQRLNEAAKLMDILLLDHVIIAGNEYLSMSDEGLI